MHPVSRIEMIVVAQEVEKILNILEQEGVPGYTLIRNVIGKGDFGIVSDDLNLGSNKLNNVFIICYCPPEKTKQVVEKIKPILNKYGGVCYISEAMEIRSLKGVAKL